MTRLTVEDIRQVAHAAVRAVVGPGAVRADREAAFPFESVRALADGGLLGIVVPEEFGGAGLGPRAMTAAVEAVASGCPSTALVLVAHSAACSAISAAGDASLRRRLLPELAAGRLLGGFAVHELVSGCAAAPVETRAARVDDGFPGIAQTVEPRKGIRVMSKTRETRKGTGENCTCGCWRRDEAPERRGMGGAEKTARGQEKTAERLAAAEKPPRRTAARRPQVST